MKTTIKILLVSLSFGAGYGLNKLLAFAIDNFFVSYEIYSSSDDVLILDKKCLERGTPKDLENIDGYYGATDYPTNCENLLDYMICANRYHTPGAAISIYKTIVPQFVEEDFLSLRMGQFDPRIMSACYTLNHIGCDFLYNAAKNHDRYTISFINDMIWDGQSFYDDKLDSFPRKYLQNPTLKFQIGNPSVWNDKVVY